MIFSGDVYVVCVDGFFVGIAENQDEIVEIASTHTDGINPLYDDDWVDRVWYDTINVNRWYAYDKYNCSDKLSGDNIMCYNDSATEQCVELMNKLTLEKERAEAKLRAMTL